MMNENEEIDVRNKVDWNMWHGVFEDAIANVNWDNIKDVGDYIKINWVDCEKNDNYEIDSYAIMNCVKRHLTNSIYALSLKDDKSTPVYDSINSIQTKVWIEGNEPKVSIKFVIEDNED